MNENKTPASSHRIALENFGKWLVKQEPNWLLTPQAYLYCVDGCRPDEASQRFSMVEHISQRAGKTPEEIACWHTLYGQVYQKDRETFVEAAYHWERRLRTQLMPFQLISEVKPKKAEYLLEPYLPKGMLTVLGLSLIHI